MSKRITLIESNSIDPDTVKKVEKEIPANSTILVCLDSNYTKSHVLAELSLYSKFVTSGSYLVVFDMIMPELVGLPGSQEN